MRRIVLAWALIVWSIASLGVELEQDALGPRLDLLTMDIAFARGQNPGRRAGLYRFTAGLALTPAPDDSRGMFVPADATIRPAWTEKKLELARVEQNGFRFVSGGERPYLVPLLSFGSAEQKLNLRIRRHSLLFQYRQDFH